MKQLEGPFFNDNYFALPTIYISSKDRIHKKHPNITFSPILSGQSACENVSRFHYYDVTTGAEMIERSDNVIMLILLQTLA